MGDTDRAVAECDRALNVSSRCVEAFCCRGHVYLNRDRYAEAVADFTRALAIDKSRDDALSMRGSAYCGLREWDLALADCDAAFKIRSGDNDINFIRGVALYGANRRTEAAASFKTYLERDPAGHDKWHTIARKRLRELSRD